MGGIYIHIPFCRQACNYCDFHFSTSTRNKAVLVASLRKELILRSDYISAFGAADVIETIYLGGGTPSLLSQDELMSIFDVIYKHYTIASDPEITLEANPDDLTIHYLQQLKQTPVNRLSIGIQSFIDSHLQWMNRAHNSKQAVESVNNAAAAGFNNISIDLIYGIPELQHEQWIDNINKATSLPVQHLSCYCLTVEPGTALGHLVKKDYIRMPDDEISVSQFRHLITLAEQIGFHQYEISNFAKEGFHSRHNTSYWKGLPYIGVGPSAHSYDGNSRQWNVSNNALYIKSVNDGFPEFEREELNATTKYNEYIMVSLRTVEGINLEQVNTLYGNDFLVHLRNEAGEYIQAGNLIEENGFLRLTLHGKFIADRIASDLFL